MTTVGEVWHAAGREARDDRKRLLALQGLLWSGPLLVLGSILVRLPHPDLPGLRHPLRYVIEPLETAWLFDRDLAVVGYVTLQLLLLALLWGLFAGAIYRLAAVGLAKGRRDDGRAALAFARRHWRAYVGARVAIWLGVAVPLLAATALAAGGRLPGWIGTILLAVAVVAAVALAIAAIVVLSVDLLAGILTGPTVACEDSDAFDAVSRTFTYAGAGLPRILWLRILFGFGVLLGTVWRLLRTVAVVAVVLLCLRVGAGADALDRALAILRQMGAPPDATRLGITDMDYVVAFVLALSVGGLLILWAADAVSRILTARTAIYLILRRDIDRVPFHQLRTAPHSPGHLGAEDAGFVEVSRIE